MVKAIGSSADSFGTFLENISSSKQAPPATPNGAPFKLLTILANSGSQPVPDLLSGSGIGFSDFTGALHSMQEAGLVTLAGASGQEQVALTASGEQVAKMQAAP